jgi:PAS domain S-box-containing protein
MPDHYELHTAPSYAEALSMARHRNYDICFAPSRIGEKSVTELLSEMSGNEWEIPVTILTAVPASGIDDVHTTARNDARSPAGDLLCVNFLEQHIGHAMERNRVEPSALQAGEEWGHIFDAVPDPIAIIDRNHVIQRVNKAMAQRLGSKPSDLIGRPCYEVVHGLSSPAPACPMSLTLKDGWEHRAEIFEERLNGIFLVSVSPLLDHDNNLVGVIHVARDITELKKIERALRESNEKLEQNVEMRTSELARKALDLEESNIALKVLLKQREQDRKEIQESVTHNIRELVFPNLDRMAHGILSREQLHARLREIKGCLENVVSPAPRSLSGKGLSPA